MINTRTYRCMYIYKFLIILLNHLAHVVGSVVSLLKLNYIYILGFLCVAVLCILPLVAFPVIVSIPQISSLLSLVHCPSELHHACL